MAAVVKTQRRGWTTAVSLRMLIYSHAKYHRAHWKPKPVPRDRGSSTVCGLSIVRSIRHPPTSPAIRRKVSTQNDSHTVQRETLEQ